MRNTRAEEPHSYISGQNCDCWQGRSFIGMIESSDWGDSARYPIYALSLALAKRNSVPVASAKTLRISALRRVWQNAPFARDQSACRPSCGASVTLF